MVPTNTPTLRPPLRTPSPDRVAVLLSFISLLLSVSLRHETFTAYSLHHGHDHRSRPRRPTLPMATHENQPLPHPVAPLYSSWFAPLETEEKCEKFYSFARESFETCEGGVDRMANSDGGGSGTEGWGVSFGSSRCGSRGRSATLESMKVSENGETWSGGRGGRGGRGGEIG